MKYSECGVCGRRALKSSMIEQWKNTEFRGRVFGEKFTVCKACKGNPKRRG